jgi:hypothetical protein
MLSNGWTTAASITSGTLFQTDIQTKEFRRIVDLQYINHRRHDINKTRDFTLQKQSPTGDINGTPSNPTLP